MKKILLFIIVGFLFSSCIFNDKKEQKEEQIDSYFTLTGGRDYRRLPLIKPLELWSIDQKTWVLAEIPNDFRTNFNSISSIVSLTFHENCILIRSFGKTYIKGKEYQNGWYIIDLKNKKIDGYLEYKILEDSITYKYKINVDTLKWYNVDNIYNQFVVDKEYPWKNIIGQGLNYKQSDNRI